MSVIRPTRFAKPTPQRDTITVGGVVFTADDLGNPTPGDIAFDDLTDVVITAPTEGDIARFDGADWVNYSGHYEPVIHDFGSGPELVFDAGDIVMEWFA
jgi:hypothetical protein